ncbi:polyisoprenoid-binding protein [Solimonas fluminis]|uniref:Polyisoprenoid-binding protein n=1 Tax=Solimonas fluminis TaxID=2086571 RepID=A0A2S5TJD4_9GAMM|nr:YceI family protein [Solimonas fluminis]PPE75100.1 polyisoprenoid-binding protein [Solimonas fluminis]
MKKSLLAAVLLSAATLSAQAAESTYKIDPTHTFPTFEISHLGFSTFRGRFDKTEGSITLDIAKKTGSVDVTIDANSISTGVAKLDEHLKNEDFFDTKKYPTISFKSTKFKFDGDKLDEVTGDLTMHGVTKPVTLDVDDFVCKQHPLAGVWACGANLETKIKRSEWGISKYSPNVGEEVELKIEVEAHQQKDAAGSKR